MFLCMHTHMCVCIRVCVYIYTYICVCVKEHVGHSNFFPCIDYGLVSTLSLEGKHGSINATVKGDYLME